MEIDFTGITKEPCFRSTFLEKKVGAHDPAGGGWENNAVTTLRLRTDSCTRAIVVVTVAAAMVCSSVCGTCIDVCPRNAIVKLCVDVCNCSHHDLDDVRLLMVLPVHLPEDLSAEPVDQLQGSPGHGLWSEHRARSPRDRRCNLSPS